MQPYSIEPFLIPQTFEMMIDDDVHNVTFSIYKLIECEPRRGFSRTNSMVPNLPSMARGSKADA